MQDSLKLRSGLPDVGSEDGEEVPAWTGADLLLHSPTAEINNSKVDQSNGLVGHSYTYLVQIMRAENCTFGGCIFVV